MRRSRKTEGVLRDLTQNAASALTRAVFEGAQEVDHAGVAGHQLGDGTRLGGCLEDGAAFDDGYDAEELAGAGVDHQVDAVLAEGDRGFEFLAAGGCVGVAIELSFEQDVEVTQEVDDDAPQPQQRPQGRVDQRCHQGVRHGRDYKAGLERRRIWPALSSIFVG